MILITGASGFVGTALCESLQSSEWRVRGAVRNLNQARRNGKIKYKEIEIGDISNKTDWLESLRDVTHVVHLAARVHVMHEKKCRSNQRVSSYQR